MYVNFQVLKSHNLLPEDVYFLCALKQTEKEVLEAIPEPVLDRYKELSLVSSIKGSLKGNQRHRLRLSDTGKDLLVKLSFEGACDNETESLGDWIISYYKSKNGGIVKNKTELKRRLQWFKTITNIRGNFLAVLIQCAISDTYDPECGYNFYDYKKQNPRAMLSNLADNLFWSPTSIYDKHKTLDKSPLYIYYEDNKEYVEYTWKLKLDENGNKK